MTRFYISKLMILIVLLTGWNLVGFAQTTFTYTGVVQTYQVPTAVTSLAIDAMGGAGGAPYTNGTAVTRSLGGRVQCNLAVSGGEILYLYVGGQGGSNLGSPSGGTLVSGGWNGGENDIQAFGAASAGASDIRLSNIPVGTYDASSRVVVAGGGGAGGDWYAEGGCGGGTTGGAGGTSTSCGGCTGGSGGTPSTFGPTGTNHGALGLGGVGSSGTYGPGGGGYWGGNSGVGEGGGGGGSSYTDAILCSSVTHTQCYSGATGNGAITITILCSTPSSGVVLGNTNICTGISSTLTTTATSGGVWTSSNTGVATIGSSTGVITGVATGTSVISYSLILSCGTAYASTTVTVYNMPSAITGANTICTAIPITVSSAPAGGVWSSANGAIAGAAAGGVVTGYTPGSTTISYTIGPSCTVTWPVTVNPSPAVITGIPKVCTGQSTALGNTVSGGVWSSSNSAIAGVGTTGNVSGVAAGLAGISYTLPAGCFSFVTVTVNQLPAPVTGTTHVCVGSATNLADAITGGTWSSSNSFVASVNASTGQVTGVVAGSPSISYTLPGGCSATTGVTVNPLPAAITGTMNVCAGSTTNLADATGAGTWSSSLTSLATVNSSGVVTGVAAGNPAITFTLSSTGCAVSTPVLVNAVPAIYNVTEGGGYCLGGTGAHVGLSNSDVGVTYYLFNGSTLMGSAGGSTSGLDFGPMTVAGTYTVSATNAAGCSSNMAGSTVVYVNLPPTIDTVEGGGYYCGVLGATGVPVTMTNSDMGVKYQLYNTGVAVGLPVNGTGIPLSFGNQTGAGNYTVTAINTSTLCTSIMDSSATVIINQPPIAFAMNPGGSYCTGTTTGVDIFLDSSSTGVNYQLFYDGGMWVLSQNGTGGIVDFGTQTGTGTYIVVGTNNTNGCVTTMAGVATVGLYPLPAIYPVTGGGGYCAGGLGQHIGVEFSVTGTKYQLYNSLGAPVGTAVSGSASELDFGFITAPDTYTVTATDVATGCVSVMADSAVITINPLPDSLFAVSGTSGYCAGGTGVDIPLSGSESGVNYQLYNGIAPVGGVMHGTGLALDFGLHTVPGTYTVGAVNPLTLCASHMAGNNVITINPLPNPQILTGGGTYCAGAGGKDIMLLHADTGVRYQLYDAGVLIPGAVVTGPATDFGNQSAGGVYTAVATNISTGCTGNATGAPAITVNPLPAIYPVTGGGDFCLGGTGRTITITGTNTGINYQLFNGAVPASSVVSGTGTAINYGLHSTPGTYKIVATNPLTGCFVTTTDSAVITVDSLPVVYTVGGGGQFCAGGTGKDVYLSASQTGINYQLYVAGVPTGSAVPGSATGDTLDFGSKTAPGAYTVVATTATTAACTSNMAASATITVNALPTAYSVSGGGSFCSGDSGAHIFLSLSNPSIRYTVHNGSGVVGSFFAGTGYPLDFGAYTAAGTYTVSALDPSTTCANTMDSNATITVTPSVTPVVSISTSSPNGDTVCEGTSTTFTANGTHPGTSPVYQWYVHGASVGFGSTYNYTPAGGDVVMVKMTSDTVCATPATVSNTAIITAIPGVLPSVSVAVSPSNLVCMNTALTFTATPVYGGTSPAYSWVKNGAVVGTGITYSYTATSNDVVFAQMASNLLCHTDDFVYSNDIAVTINEAQVPDFSITANPGTNLVSGESVVFTANVINSAGATFQWKLNGVAISGETGPTYFSNSLTNDEVVSCEVTNHNVCGNADASQSVAVKVYNNVGVQVVATSGINVTLVPNPNKGTFTIKGSLGNTNDQEVSLEVTNMLGQVVYTGKATAHGGDLNERVQLSSSLANGMYILNMHAGAESKVFHFVIEQ